MNGYDFCKKILEHEKGGVEQLLKLAGEAECEWLELKAGVQLTPEDAAKGDKPEDLYWSIANAIIGLMNTYGGAVIIGIDDHTHNLVPLESNDPRHIIKDFGVETYFRREIYERVWSDSTSVGKKNWKTKDQFHMETALPNLIEIKGFSYQNGYVAVILVKPSKPECLRVWKGQVEEIRIRALGAIGKTIEKIGAKNMADYEKKERQLDVPGPYLESYYHNFLDQVDKAARKKLFKWKIAGGIAAVILIVFVCLFGVPLIKPIPEITPIPGKTLPDQIIVKHPLWTIEWQCMNSKIWWITSDTCETCYGTWELQRNRAFSNFRIVDCRNIMRCWGTQAMVQPIFEELKVELKRKAGIDPPVIQKLEEYIEEVGGKLWPGKQQDQETVLAEQVVKENESGVCKRIIIGGIVAIILITCIWHYRIGLMKFIPKVIPIAGKKRPE